MRDLPDTRESLLIRLSDTDDRDAWEQFSSIYQPVVYRMARLRGMQDADAQDLTQRVLISISQSVANWKPQPGTKFRHWLARVAKNAAINLMTRQPRDRGTGNSELAKLQLACGPTEELERSYELEYQRQVYRQAANNVRQRADEKTWLAFSLTMVDGLSIEEAATQLGVGPGTIYAARSRIVRRLRTEVQNLDEPESQENTNSQDVVGESEHEH